MISYLKKIQTINKGELQKSLISYSEPSSQALSGSTTTKSKSSSSNLPIIDSTRSSITFVITTTTATEIPNESTSTLRLNSTIISSTIVSSTTNTDDAWDWGQETTTPLQSTSSGSSAMNQDESSYISYGLAAGDHTLTKLDDVSYAVHLNVSFKYFKKYYTTFYVGSNGLLSFFPYTEHTPRLLPLTNSPFVCPFWADIDISKQGDVYYREINDKESLNKVESDINTYYKPSKLKPADFKSHWAFVVTWNEVSSHSSSFFTTPSVHKNTFQLILVSDAVGNETYGIFNYMKLEWPTYFVSHQKFLAGYNGDNSYLVRTNYMIIEKINFANLINRSNVNKPGKWIFKFSELD
jgi:hypothetical protein